MSQTQVPMRGRQTASRRPRSPPAKRLWAPAPVTATRDRRLVPKPGLPPLLPRAQLQEPLEQPRNVSPSLHRQGLRKQLRSGRPTAGTMRPTRQTNPLHARQISLVLERRSARLAPACQESLRLVPPVALQSSARQIPVARLPVPAEERKERMFSRENALSRAGIGA